MARNGHSIKVGDILDGPEGALWVVERVQFAGVVAWPMNDLGPAAWQFFSFLTARSFEFFSTEAELAA